MKKGFLLAALLSALLILSACGSGTQQAVENNDDEEKKQIELTLWTYPVGNWGNQTAVASLLSGFHKENPDILISVEYLTYQDGDAKIEQAVKDGNLPNMVLEGPERLVANWGDRGLMADLSDLWESEKASQIYDLVKKACRYSDGSYYEFPLCTTAHCMAINYDMFKEAGALQYINEKTRMWTTEDFIKAVEALVKHGQKRAGILFCKDQSGDQGTRALVNNLYSGLFTDDANTTYTLDSEENIKALELLKNMEGIAFDPSITALETVELFMEEKTAMTFVWNVFQEIQQTINREKIDFDIFPMAFPTDNGIPELQGGIWGFGIFDNGNEEQIEASKTFIRYITEDDERLTRAVRTSTYWPVRDVGNIYENDKLMTEYSIFTPYMGDYYQITPDWPTARAAWWKMLQQINEGADIRKIVKKFPYDIK